MGFLHDSLSDSPFVSQFSDQSQVNNNSTLNSPTEEQRAEAERLKSDGESRQASARRHERGTQGTSPLVNVVFN